MIAPDCLKKIFLLQDLTSEEIQQVLKLAHPRHIPAGETVIREGEPGDSMFIMCQGEVEITKRLILSLGEEVPKERVMSRLRAEDGVSFGEMALLENDTRSATVTALTDCHFLELSRRDFLDFIERHPRTGCKLLLRMGQWLSRNLRRTDQDVVKLTTALAIALGG
ncbi:MAG: cyclic nucleotide-binding domain-containing protein [Deltaproteobacteria bacterium]|nr:cyclic nucleotide-binding domain-containing protein [Deltaproteobacteria bacterium]